MKIKYVNANKIKCKQKGDPETETHSQYPWPVDDNGNRVWDLTEHINSLSKPQNTPSQPSKPQGVSNCSTCGEAVSEDVKRYSEQNFNKVLCRTHQK